jgi:hypothetical protein
VFVEVVGVVVIDLNTQVRPVCLKSSVAEVGEKIEFWVEITAYFKVYFEAGYT